MRGDRIERPKGGGGSGGGGKASDSGEGDDDFVFHLSKEEFMQVFFDDLALPNLTRTTLAETPEYKTHRAGFSSDGNPSNLHVCARCAAPSAGASPSAPGRGTN